MSEPLSRLYDLALRTLDDHERRVEVLRGRLGPTLAAAALGVTLLSGPVVGGARPHGIAGTLTLVVAVGGLFVAVFSALAILTARGRPAGEIDLNDILDRLDIDDGFEDATTFYLAMITRLRRQATANTRLLDRLHARFSEMVCGILVMVCGLALAALVG